MRSMTGYGRAQSRDGSEVVVRAVNGRYLELRAHLPKEYLFLEASIKEIVGAYCSRGTVDIFFSPSSELLDQKLVVNLELAKKWHKAMEKVASACGISSESVNVERLIASSGVVHFVPEARKLKRNKVAVLALVRQASEQCLNERKREGTKLKSALLDILSDLETSVGRIRQFVAEHPERIRGRTEVKLKRILDQSSGRSGLAANDGLNDRLHDRIVQEVALLADRSDVSEELERLQTHIMAYRRLLKRSAVFSSPKQRPEGIGKRLEFYTQELLREVNTIGSKLAEIEVTEEVVNAKSFIEKLREQVQNVE